MAGEEPFTPDEVTDEELVWIERLIQVGNRIGPQIDQFLRDKMPPDAILAGLGIIFVRIVLHTVDSEAAAEAFENYLNLLRLQYQREVQYQREAQHDVH